MKDAFIGIVASYSELTGTSKIVLLFLVSVIAVILMDENKTDGDAGRRVNPAVFLLSVWSGISYAAVRIVSGRKKPVFIVGTVFILAMIILSGNLVITSDYYLSSVWFGTKPSIKILSALSLLIYLLLYVLISQQLFEARTERVLFICFAAVLHLFAGYSDKAMQASLIMAPVSIASVAIHDVLPLLMYLYLVFEDKIVAFAEGPEEAVSAGVMASGGVGTAGGAGVMASGGTATAAYLDEDEIPEEWDMKKHKILNMRNMAIAFLAMIVVFGAAIFVLNSKINSLYEATVLLENAANSKMTVDELKGPDGSVVMTVMVSPEGSVTIIGGGPASTGTESLELIRKYSETVDTWYLDGEDESCKGAYDFCVGEGISVNETLVVTGVERLD